MSTNEASGNPDTQEHPAPTPTTCPDCGARLVWCADGSARCIASDASTGRRCRYRTATPETRLLLEFTESVSASTPLTPELHAIAMQATAELPGLHAPKAESTTVRNRRRRELLRVAWLVCEPTDRSRQALPVLVASCILNVSSPRFPALIGELEERIVSMLDLVRRAK